jgi:hypothetical protein
MRTTASLGDTLMRVHGLIRLNLIRKIQNSVIICALIFIGYKWQGLPGIAWSIFASTIISYIMMIAIIRKRIFPGKWAQLVFRPYYNGFILTLCWVLPCYFIFMALHSFIENEIIAFTVLCGVVAATAILIFVKKPKLLGSDIEYIQEDFLQMFRKKSINKKNTVSQATAEKI